MREEFPYNIVIVANDAYIQHACVMLCSLFENNLGKKFYIHLLSDGISEKSKKILSEFCEKYESTFSEYVCNMDKLSNLQTARWSPIMYFKLLMPIIIPEHIHRCLFLDVDVIINDDIDGLYNYDLGKNVIAAAEDIPDCIKHKKRLNLKENVYYINSGVMVCDLTQWRDLQKERDIISYALNSNELFQNDQDVISSYFQGKIQILPIRWNMVTHYFLYHPRIFEKYLGELSQARRMPGIIHFSSPIKPWYKDCGHPYGCLYEKYKKLTPYKKVELPYYKSRLRIPLRMIKRYFEHMRVLEPIFFDKIIYDV